MGQAEGQVRQAQAQLELAEINVKRDTPLAEARAIAQSQLDNEKQQAAQATRVGEFGAGGSQSGACFGERRAGRPDHRETEPRIHAKCVR